MVYGLLQAGSSQACSKDVPCAVLAGTGRRQTAPCQWTLLGGRRRRRCRTPFVAHPWPGPCRARPSPFSSLACPVSAPLAPTHRPRARSLVPRAGTDPRRLTRILPCSACVWDARRSRCEMRGPCCVACSPARPGQVARRERHLCTRQDDGAAFACKSWDDR